MTDGEVLNTLSLNNDTSTTVQYGETSVTTKESVFIWIIKNVSKCYISPGKGLDSPTYEVELNDRTTSWVLKYYPNGINNSYDSWTSLSLLESTCNKAAMEIYIKICTIDKYGIEQLQYKNFLTISPTEILQFTMEKFISKTNLSNFIFKGDLKIIFRIYNNVEYSVLTSPSNIYKSIIDKSETSNYRLTEFDDFGKLLNNSKFSDVKLVTNDRSFLAHKAILSVRSRVFEAMFEHDMKETNDNVVTITDIDGEIVKEMLRFIYAGKVDDLEKIADKLLIAADKYELNGLKAICEDALLTSLSDKTVQDILILVDCYNAERLRDDAIEFITAHTNELSLNDNFNATIKTLSPSLFALVIKALMSRA